MNSRLAGMAIGSGMAFAGGFVGSALARTDDRAGSSVPGPLASTGTLGAGLPIAPRQPAPGRGASALAIGGVLLAQWAGARAAGALIEDRARVEPTWSTHPELVSSPLLTSPFDAVRNRQTDPTW